MRFAIILSAFGLADSLFLLHSNLFCSDVCSLQVLPFPTWIACVSAATWFSFGFVIAFLEVPKLVKAWMVIGVLGIAFFFTYSIYSAYFCPYCYAAHLAGFLLILAVAKQV